MSIITIIGWWVSFDAGGRKINVSARLFAFFEGWAFFFSLLAENVGVPAVAATLKLNRT